MVDIGGEVFVKGKNPKMNRWRIGINKPIEEVAKDMERDYFMSAEDALKYGIVDAVMPKRKNS